MMIWFPRRHKTSQNILQLAKDAKDKLQKAAEADKSTDTSVSSDFLLIYLSSFSLIISIFVRIILLK